MARRPRMTYVPLDVEFFDNERVLVAGEKAAYLYLAMCCRAKKLLSDGILSVLQVERLQVPGWKRRMADLIDAGLVVLLDDGRYVIIGWLERNLSAQQVESLRRKDRGRKASDDGPDSGPIPPGIPTDSAPIPDGFRVDPKGREVEGKGREVEVDLPTDRPPLRVLESGRATG